MSAMQIDVSAPLLVAAGLAVMLAVVHSYLGERYILVRLFRREGLPRLFGGTEFTRRTLRLAWHLTSVAWVGLAALLVRIGVPTSDGRPSPTRVIAATFLISGAVALVGSRGRHLSWIVLFAIGGLVWFGGR